MWFKIVCTVVCVSALLPLSEAMWQCAADADCASLAGSVCSGGRCACPVGTVSVQGGTVCQQWSPYYTSACIENHQCARLFTSYECRLEDSSSDGSCYCLPNNHYFRGRCWADTELGAACTSDEQCQGVLRDPFSMTCKEGVCDCADGYYFRQRGECRRSAFAVGGRCVLDEDCNFEGGVCDQASFTCYINGTRGTLNRATLKKKANGVDHMESVIRNEMADTRQHGVICGAESNCTLPFQCSALGVCICPLGYYVNDDETDCLAELGSPSTAEQCVGLFAEVIDGICTCPANHYYEENMRDCIKPTIRLSDSCVTDQNCHTFGAAARCGAAQAPWGLRSCECLPDVALWDEARKMCRLVVGLGEPCTADSDCVASDVELRCDVDSTGQGYCACPTDYEVVDGQCLTDGLVLGDTCRASQECTGIQNAICNDTVCVCAPEYVESNGLCNPGIGGTCSQDADCMVELSYCASGANGSSCQCRSLTIEYQGACYEEVTDGFGAACVANVQCSHSLGEGASCVAGACACDAHYHYRDGGCWPRIDLFQSCSRTSECYLGDDSEWTVCRNGLCQCLFTNPYSEELNTCTSSAPTIAGSFLTLLAGLYLLLNMRFS